MSDPCNGCGCMLEDNLGCPEMKHCYDYHKWKDPNFVRSIEVLNPLVEEMIRIRKHDNLERAQNLIQKAYNEFFPSVPAETIYGKEIYRLLDLAQRDSNTLDENYKKHLLRLAFDV